MKAPLSLRSAAAIGVASFFLAGVPQVHAETIVSQRIHATRRLLPPDKVTVGPDDQYNGAVDAAGRTLVFTHKADLVPHLRRQDLQTGEASDLLGLTADSQESAISPEGLVAFTYYKFNARGDICYAAIPKAASQAVADERITCLKPAAGEGQAERSIPFWRSSSELGYVVRDITTQQTQIVAEDIHTGQRHVLAQGKVWSPAMKAGGRYLFYSELVDENGAASRMLMLKDLATGLVRPVRFALPGISGFPAVSGDEQYLYFSHYLDDTSHDNVIDGSDNSVVFRAPIARILAQPAGQRFFPEQLTSVESNCSFPHPFGETLYVSCAFQGSLDVYRIPATGIVPKDWDAAILNNAHQTSRTYSERILLLNTMKYRWPAATPAGAREMEERLLGDHLLSDDMTAARYYVDELQATASADRRDFYALLHQYVQAREIKKKQPSAEISREFLKQIQGVDAKVQAVRGQPRLQRIVRGLLRAFLEQPREALSFLTQVRFDGPALPMERYLSFELASWTLPRTQPEGNVVQALLAQYRGMVGAPELTEEEQIYYAFNLLKYLQQAEPASPGLDGTLDPEALARRARLIGEANHGLPAPVTSLLKSELAVLDIIRAPDEAAKTKAYAPLDQLMSASRGDYFLRKALYVRAILNFAEAGEFKFMDYVATNWLRYTAAGDTEFIHAREFFAEAELDHAYESWGKKNPQLAASYFYGSLSLTDDLESHAGYLRTMVARGARTTIDERYKNLKQREFIEDNLKFVEALLGLIDAEPAARQNPGQVQHLDAAIAKLTAMVQDRESPVRYLLLGYCYLDRLLRASSGYEIDQKLLELAHRNLMLAYDLGRDNARIRASVLMDLGILHQRAQNHGLAARFFGLRKPLGFVSSDEAASFSWLYARSLFYTHDPEKAADELAHSPGDVGKEFVGPLLEREAFYRTQAGQYEQAIELYEKLLEGGHIQGDASLAKVNLSYGLGLLKLKRDKLAMAALRASLAHAEKLEKAPKGRERLIEFDPVRIRLAAYGLLSRMGTDAERLAALESRAKLLPQARKLFDTSYLPTVIENRLSIAGVVSRTQPAAAAMRLKEGLAFAEELGDSDLGYLSNAIFRAASQFLAHAWLHPELYAGEKAERIRKVVEKTLQAYGKQQGPQPVLDYQKLKLELLWEGYQAKSQGSGKAAQPKLEAILAGPASRGLKDALPGQWKELQALSVALGR